MLHLMYLVSPRGGGLEYLHHSPASRRRRRKGNPVPGGITGQPCHSGTNTETWTSKLGVGRKADDLAVVITYFTGILGTYNAGYICIKKQTNIFPQAAVWL
jgi:hypothetical protein